MAKKLLITNLVYGPMYADIFLNQHLKSLLDPTNIPAVKERVEYLIFTDRDTMPALKEHSNFIKLQATIGADKVEFGEIQWPANANLNEKQKFDARYNMLIATFIESVKKALAKDMLLSAIVADLVAAREFLPRTLAKIDSGEHDAVFMQPPRCVAESVIATLDSYPRAMHSDELWALCYRFMHPLWQAAHWDAAQFAGQPGPFSLVWNSGAGLLVHSFSITPAIFTPYESMLTPRGVIDRFIPSLCKQPYWATDWDECPLIGVEPFMCYWPPWANHRATTEWTRGWMKANLDPVQLNNAKQKLYYPNKAIAKVPETMETTIDAVMKEILQ